MDDPLGKYGGDAVAWISAERARSGVRALASLLAPRGMELLVLKGVYYAHCVAPMPWFRAMGDSDVLLLRGSFDEAIDLVRDTSAPTSAG